MKGNIKRTNHFADREHMTRGLPFENVPQQRLCIHFALQKIFMSLISMLFELIYWSKIILNVAFYIKRQKHDKFYNSLYRYICSRRDRNNDTWKILLTNSKDLVLSSIRWLSIFDQIDCINYFHQELNTQPGLHI